MEQTILQKLKPGSKVKVTQQIPARNYAWTTEIRGTIISFDQQPTGSWFAHAQSGKFWLDRLVLKKEDGEITTLNLDKFSRIEFEQP